MSRYNDEIKRLEVLKEDTVDEDIKKSIEKRLEILKERKTVLK